MPLDSHLIHRCTVSKVTVGPDNPLGGPGEETLAIVYIGNCRLVEKTENRMASGIAEPYFVTRYVLLLPAWAAIKEGYRVHNLIDERGVAIDGTFTIKAVKARRSTQLHHHSLELERI